GRDAPHRRRALGLPGRARASRARGRRPRRALRRGASAPRPRPRLGPRACERRPEGGRRRARRGTPAMSWFTEPWSYAFFRHGLLASVLAGALCGLVGVYVVLRR